jgi:hypothetical protein
MIRTSLGKADGKHLAKAGNEPAGTPPPFSPTKILEKFAGYLRRIWQV